MPHRPLAASRRSGAGVLAALPPPPQRSEEYNLSAEEYHLSADGLIFSFGWNGHGQLGLGDDAERDAPRPLRSLLTSGVRVRLVAAGSSHTVAIDEHGVGHSWGNNAHGQCGVGDLVVRTAPEAIGCDGQRLVAVACGARHTLFCTSRGRVLACGSNGDGQLGLGTPADEQASGQGELVVRPEPLPALGGTRVVAVACGFAHTLFLTRPGAVLACGAAECGQLGLSSAIEQSAVFTPTSVAQLASVPCRAVCAGNFHSVALARDDGGVYTWGEGRYGRLGHGTGTTERVPRLVQGPLLAAKVRAALCC